MKFARHLGAIASLTLLSAVPVDAATPFETDTAPVKIVVPFAAGTGADVIARALAQELGPSLKRPVIIDNKPGAGGNIGTESAAKSAPDGRTLLLTVNNTVVVNPLLYRKLGFNALKDLQPLTLISTGGYVVVATPQQGMKSVAELIRRGKVDDLRYGSYGVGSMSQICTEMFQASTGTKMRHVPYRATTLNDLLAGEIELSFEPFGGARGFIQSGQLTALAVTTPYRLASLPNVPTVGESIPGYDCRSWVGMFLPAGTPSEIQTFLQQKLATIISSPEFVKVIEPQGHKVDIRGPAEFGQMVQADYAKWQAVIKPLNIQLD